MTTFRAVYTIKAIYLHIVYDFYRARRSGVGTYLSGTDRAVPLLKVGRLVMHFAVPLFGHRLHIALMIDVSFIVT